MSDFDEDLLNRHRWIRVMADYSCDGVWDIEGNSCGTEELPISPALVERLRRWQAHYEAIEDAIEEENRLPRESDWTDFPPKVSPLLAPSRPNCPAGRYSTSMRPGRASFPWTGSAGYRAPLNTKFCSTTNLATKKRIGPCRAPQECRRSLKKIVAL